MTRIMIMLDDKANDKDKDEDNANDNHSCGSTTDCEH